MRLKRNYHFVQYSQGSGKLSSEAPKDPLANMDDRLLAGEQARVHQSSAAIMMAPGAFPIEL